MEVIRIPLKVHWPFFEKFDKLIRLCKVYYYRVRFAFKGKKVRDT